MTIYVSGDSNSVRRNGWVAALAADPRTPSEVRNISIGGAPSHMSLLRAIKLGDLSAGDVFIWAYGINDALYIHKAGYTCDEMIWCIRRIIQICARAGAVFAPMIFQPRRHSQQPGVSEYRARLHDLFEEHSIPFFDMDQAYLANHPDQDLLPLHFYEDYLHYAQTDEVTMMLVEGALRLIDQAHVPTPEEDEGSTVRLIEEFPMAEAGTLENSAVGRVATWKPGPEGIEANLQGKGRVVGIFVTTTQHGGAWDISFANHTSAISTAFADRQFNRTMLKFISPAAVTGFPFRFDGPQKFAISWSKGEGEVMADFWFLRDPDPVSIAAQEARLVSIMVEIE